MLPNLAAGMRVRGVRGYQVAQAAGVSEWGFSRFLNGRDQLTPAQRERIAAFLRADPSWLFCKTIKIPPLAELAVAAAASTGDRSG